ncbi:MAG: hypothetical protein WBQ26_15540 [Gemmatimonadaceae bacterium]|nr:hypothetical protein [Gemmatimonadaceae bacterium]
MTDLHPVLNEHQRRHFAVLLVGLDEALARIEELADQDRQAWGPLTEYADDLPPRFTAEAYPLIADLRSRVLALGALLRTDSRHMSRARSIRAMVTSATIRLEDSRARGLRGYGAVDPSVHEQLDPVLDDLIERFRAVGRLAAWEAAGPNRPERS